MNKPLLLVAGIAIVGTLVRAIKEDALGVIFARYGLPQVPKRALPWVSLILGLLLAVFTELNMRGFDAWIDALVYGVLEGLGISVTAMGLHDLGRGLPGLNRVLGLALLLLPLGITSCKEAETPRETARSVVVLAAKGVSVADAICASVATDRQDTALAEACARDYSEAREWLTTAEMSLDLADAVARRDAPCAVAKAAKVLRRMRDRIAMAGGRPPPVIDDALRYAPVVAGACGG